MSGFVPDLRKCRLILGHKQATVVQNIFYAKILKIFFYLIACIESRTLRNTCTVVGVISSLQSAQAHLLCNTGDYKYLSSIDEEAKQ